MLNELKEELEFAIQQLEKAADWAPTPMTTGVIKLQCEEAKKLIAKVESAIAQDETAQLLERLVRPKV